MLACAAREQPRDLGLGFAAERTAKLAFFRAEHAARPVSGMALLMGAADNVKIFLTDEAAILEIFGGARDLKDEPEAVS
jgi:hypothetical protein